MIRVIYRWNIKDSERDSVVDEWRRLTEWIRGEFDGSYGSTLLVPVDDAGSLVGLARWASDAHLRAFRTTAGSLHLPGAELLSMEVLTEVSHLTVEY